MIKNIKYSFGISDINFKNSDFIGYNLELIPQIKIDVEFDDCLLENINIFYTRNGFLVELNSEKISDIRSGELDEYINSNDEFRKDFDYFINSLRDQKVVGRL